MRLKSVSFQNSSEMTKMISIYEAQHNDDWCWHIYNVKCWAKKQTL